jgi:hypothetical protein
VLELTGKMLVFWLTVVMVTEQCRVHGGEGKKN